MPFLFMIDDAFIMCNVQGALESTKRLLFHVYYYYALIENLAFYIKTEFLCMAEPHKKLKIIKSFSIKQSVMYHKRVPYLSFMTFFFLNFILQNVLSGLFLQFTCNVIILGQFLHFSLFFILFLLNILIILYVQVVLLSKMWVYFAQKNK